MIERWEATWMGERVCLEVTTAGAFETAAKTVFHGLLGRPKARSVLLYGNQVVEERQEIDEPWLRDRKFEFCLMGKGRQPGGQEAIFHARYMYDTSTLCELQVNGTPVPMQKVSP
jgi:hypothetical protein